MSQPLADVGRLKSYAFAEFDNLRDNVLTDLLAAATDEINKSVAPRIIATDGTVLTEHYDGNLVTGQAADELWLDQWPIQSITSVSESGVALTGGEGYDPSGAYDYLKHAGRGMLRRTIGPATMQVVSPSYRARDYARWAPGWQNITVVYIGGFTETTIPNDIANVCIELAVLLWRGRNRIGDASWSRQGEATSYIDQLPQRSRKVIDRYRHWGRPKCRSY